MNSDEDKKVEDDDPEHVHRWSLLKDREFYELGDKISRYLVATQGNIDCPHTDSPLTDSIETIAAVIWRHTPLPEHPIVRAMFMEGLQTLGIMSFCAGMRFAADGNKLDGVMRFMDCEILEQPEDNRWDEDVAEGVNDWRVSRRNEHYLPAPDMTDEQRAVLEQLTGQKIPKGARVLLGEGGIGIAVPKQQDGEFQPQGDNPVNGYL